ncbi:phospholysine phosphohistidine inorganic pyrophosphate phosphatase-like [Schistocerca piceifrons]|uniref:phospholysine phosphohistidine inorganic pyrophosphate phosphatase-like n=1 Tax=Schistocerca piceifrons TaxID=274613 RepID=UPI001F5F4101|nr:phospholysine phosphohistidine inorganic pyrophosphate phosphatase-like [Schistocerca piceifrons]
MSTLKLPQRINGVLLDITGVLKDGSSAIPGSVEAVNRLKKAGLAIKLLTNETQVTRSSLCLTLSKMGYCVTEHDIIPPCPALVDLLRKEKLRPHLLVHPDVLSEFDGLNKEDPNCVVVGDAAENFSYENLNKAFRILIDMDKPRLFSMGRGKYYREKGDLVLDVGVFTTALEYATGVSAEVVGKPLASFFHSALSAIRVKPEEAVMVGDDIESDIGGAQACGIAGILVRTGKFRPCDEKHPRVKPDVIVDDLAEAVDIIVQSRN